MLKMRNMMLVFPIFAFVAVILSPLNTKTVAGNGPPIPCCMYLKGDPSQLLTAFGVERPSSFKILAAMESNLQTETPLRVLAIIDKGEVADLKGASPRLVFKVPEHVFKKQGLKAGDFILLIPLAEYSNLIPATMYDFVKIPASLLK